MTRFTLAFLAALLAVSTAWAGWNIQQKDDGTTVWINTDSETLPAGDTGLVMRIADISTADTQYVVIPRAGFVRKVYLVADSGYTPQSAAAGLTFWLEDTTPNNAFTQITGSDASTSGTFNPTTAAGPAANDSYELGTHDITTQGQVLAIVTDGNSWNGGEAWLTIIID